MGAEERRRKNYLDFLRVITALPPVCRCLEGVSGFAVFQQVLRPLPRRISCFIPLWDTIGNT